MTQRQRLDIAIRPADPRATASRLITYDAKDPDTKFPPIEQLRPPKGAPNVSSS